MLLTTVPCLQPHLTALAVRLQKIPTATRLASFPAGCSETAYSAGQLSLKWQLRECRLAIPASGKLRWAEHESEPSQGYLMRSGGLRWEPGTHNKVFRQLLDRVSAFGGDGLLILDC